MRIIIYFSLVLFLISCQKNDSGTKEFDVIDVSMYNGWTDYYSFKILQSGKIYIFNNRFRKGETYLTATLGQSEIDSLSSMVRMILSTKFKNYYESHCSDCLLYNIIIKNKDKAFKCFVNGDFGDEKLKTMRTFIIYLSQIGSNSMKALDTSFVFESKTDYFYPPPPPPSLGKD